MGADPLGALPGEGLSGDGVHLATGNGVGLPRRVATMSIRRGLSILTVARRCRAASSADRETVDRFDVGQVQATRNRQYRRACFRGAAIT
jgi:hypothetical protein